MLKETISGQNVVQLTGAGVSGIVDVNV